MTISALTAWEFRASTGSATNGGGFADLNPGTSVDYSQQAASQLSLTDCATSGIGVTTLTSATGGFTAAMEGNVMYLHTGTNLTDGWYQITGHTDTNTITLDRAPDDGGGGVSAGDCEVGGALDIITDTFLDNTSVIVAGQTIWIKNDGTMTLTGTVNVGTTIDGTATNPINLKGYNTTRADNPTGTNRPLIAAAGNLFNLGDYWNIRHLRITTTSTSGFAVENFCHVFNVDSYNSSGTGGRDAFNINNSTLAIGCDGQSDNGQAFELISSNCFLYSCYAHDSADGVQGSFNVYVINCVIDTCTVGIDLFDDNSFISNNTIYNCTTGIKETGGFGVTAIINNITDACTTGINWSSDFGESNFIDFNCYDNTTDVTNVTKGSNAVTGDPGMTDPANGDFSIPSNSNCVDKALDAGDYTDATV
jgi:hypothetical protein